MTNLILVLGIMIIPLLLIAPSLSYAITPAQHQCIKEKVSIALLAAGVSAAIGGATGTAEAAGSQIGGMVDNTTTAIESCLK